MKNYKYLPTNSANLSMFLAKGFICPPKYLNKYYKDVLENCENFIPLYAANDYLSDGLNISTQEDKNLIKIIIEFDTKSIEKLILERNQGDDDAILIKPFIPLSCIKKVIFLSKSDEERFRKIENLYNNLNIKDLKTGVVSKVLGKVINSNVLFKDNIKNSFYSEVLPQIYFDDKANSLGGTILNLLYFSDRQICLDILKFITKKIQKIKLIDSHQIILKTIDDFFNSNIQDGNIYYKIFEILMVKKDYKDEILSFLENHNFDNAGKKRALVIAKNIEDMIFNRIKDKTPKMLIKESKTILEKILKILFLKSDFSEFLSFDLTIFNDFEIAMICVFYGIKDGFIGSSKELKSIHENVQNEVSDLMVNYIYNKNLFSTKLSKTHERNSSKTL